MPTTLARVLKKEHLSKDILDVWIQPKRWKKIKPGQFLQLALEFCNGSSEWPESRTFTIAGIDSQEKAFRLLIKRQGAFTRRIFEELNVGEMCSVKYAYGEFVLPDDEEKIICVAGGTGVSPFLAFVDYLKEVDMLSRIVLLYSSKNQESIIEENKLRRLLKKENIEFYVTREKNILPNYENRRIEIDDIVKKSSHDKNTQIMICGSESFNDFFVEGLQNRGYKNCMVDKWK